MPQDNRVLIYTVTCEAYEWCNYTFSNYLLSESANWPNAEVLIVFNSSSPEWVEEQKKQWNAFIQEIGIWNKIHFIDVGSIIPNAATVGICRQKAIEFARKNDYPLLYSVDIDCYPEPGSLQVLMQLLKRVDGGIISGKYYKRLVDPLRGPYRTIAAMFREDFGMEMTTKTRINPRARIGLTGMKSEVSGVPFGFTLMTRAFFDSVDMPEMQEADDGAYKGKYVYKYNGKVYATEDLVYCAMARDKTKLLVLWTDHVTAKHLHRLETGDIEVFG